MRALSGSQRLVSGAMEPDGVAVGVVYLAVAVAPERVDGREVPVVSSTRQRRVHVVHGCTVAQPQMEHALGGWARAPPAVVVHRNDRWCTEREVRAAAEIDLDVTTGFGSVRHGQSGPAIEVQRLAHVGHSKMDT